MPGARRLLGRRLRNLRRLIGRALRRGRRLLFFFHRALQFGLQLGFFGRGQIGALLRLFGLPARLRSGIFRSLGLGCRRGRLLSGRFGLRAGSLGRIQRRLFARRARPGMRLIRHFFRRQQREEARRGGGEHHAFRVAGANRCEPSPDARLAAIDAHRPPALVQQRRAVTVGGDHRVVLVGRVRVVAGGHAKRAACGQQPAIGGAPCGIHPPPGIQPAGRKHQRRGADTDGVQQRDVRAFIAPRQRRHHLGAALA